MKLVCGDSLDGGVLLLPADSSLFIPRSFSPAPFLALPDVGGCRLRKLQMAKMLVEQTLPFSFFSSGSMIPEIIATATGTMTSPRVTSRRMKPLIVEIYTAVKKVRNKFGADSSD